MPFWDSKQGTSEPTCSFCGKAQNAVSGFIQSPSKYTCGTCRNDTTVLICNECVQLCGRFLVEHAPKPLECKRILSVFPLSFNSKEFWRYPAILPSQQQPVCLARPYTTTWPLACWRMVARDIPVVVAKARLPDSAIIPGC